MDIVSKEQVRQIVQAKKEGEFTRVISLLEPGCALRISPQEFKQRFDTPIPLYFLGKYNRKKKTVSCLKYGDSYYIIKL
jgi:hypothetical protein